MLSPGVFNSENDQSFYAPQTAEPGAAVIGPTVKGQAFVPTNCSSYNDYVLKFGSSDGNSYVPYVVRNYLKNASSILVTRVLGLSGYDHNNVGLLVASSSYGYRAIGVLHHTSTSISDTSGSFDKSTLNGIDMSASFAPSMTATLVLSGSYSPLSATSETYTISPFSDSAAYIGKIFGRSPVASKGAYLYSLFTNYCEDVLGTASAPISGSLYFVISSNLDLTDTYQGAATPWITSQKIGGVAIDLFKFHTISHGDNINTAVKVTISNVKKGSEVPGSDYGTFSILIRDINDNDRVPLVLEQYHNVTLDPDSPNYIERLIGDKYATYSNGKLVYTGDYKNMSDYVYVEVKDDVKNKAISPDLNPWGFKAVSEPFAFDNAAYYFPTASIVTEQSYNSQYNDKICFGFNFDFVTTDNKEYLKPIPSDADAGLNADFNLDNCVMHPSSSYPGNSFATDVTPVSGRKFNVPVQGGFNGYDPATNKNMGSNITATNSMGFDVSSATADGYLAYDRAITLLENKDFYDINMLFTPGIIKSLHSALISRAIDMVESRNEVFYPFDGSVLNAASLDTVVNDVSTIDSSYAGTYFPWIKIFDSELNKYLWAPGSVAFAEVVAYNDKHGYQWNAPAGLIRGGITSAVDVYWTLKQSERDTLYSGRVNPIAIFPNEGINIWGQKTLQMKASALDRVNVRRLLINLKKFFTKTGRRIVFEQSTIKTWTNFLNVANPYMESVKEKQGLYVFKVVMDSSINTSDVIDRNIIQGKVYLQPTKTGEFISFEFNITPTGADFGV